MWARTSPQEQGLSHTNEKEQVEYSQKVDAHDSKVLNYLEAMRFHYGDDVMFICGYEAYSEADNN